MRKFIERIPPLVFIYIAVFLIFFGSLFNFFLQDDFIVMSIGWIKDLADLKKIFLSFSYFPYLSFRPFTFLFFGSTTVHFFGLQPFLFHAALFLLYFATLYLLWQILGSFFPDKKTRFCSLFLYATSSIHFGALYWMSGAFVLLGTFFLLLTFHYLKRNIILALIFFIGTLLTNEGLFAFPLFLLFDKILKRKTMGSVLPFFLISGISLIFRKAISGFQMLPDYRIGELGEIVATFKWYLFRVINIPESIRSFPSSLQIVIIVLVGLLLLISLYVLYYLWVKKKHIPKNIFLGLSWFFLFGFPYFLLPAHLSGYYLHTALIGFIIAWVSLLAPLILSQTKLHNIVFFTFIISWFVLSFIGVSYLQKTSWIVRRANIAKTYISKTQKLYPFLPRGATIVFQPKEVSSQELAIALYNERALQLYYNDRTLAVIFDDTYIPKPGEYVISD